MARGKVETLTIRNPFSGPLCGREAFGLERGVLVDAPQLSKAIQLLAARDAVADAVVEFGDFLDSSFHDVSLEVFRYDSIITQTLLSFFTVCPATNGKTDFKMFDILDATKQTNRRKTTWPT